MGRGGAKKGKIVKIVERKTTELHIAAQKGEISRLKLLLENGAPVDVLDRDEASPLHHAAYNGHMKCVKKLLDFNADIELKDSEGSTPLHNAAFQGHDEICEVLIKKGASVEVEDMQGGTPLLNAACNGHDEVVKLLLKKSADGAKADQNGATPLHYAAYNGHDAVVRLLLQAGGKVDPTDNDNVTPLHHASGNGHVRSCRILVEAGSNINAEDGQGTTPLHAAAFNNHVQVIELLLNHASQNYDADLRLMLLSRQDKEGSTPLHKAAFNGDVDVLRLFLEAGVDLNVTDKEGSTPLHKASFKGNAGIMQLLLARDAKMDVRDNQGGTALYNACYNGHAMCVKLLLEKEGSAEMINLKDNQGRTPLHATACFGHWECVSLLLKHKADTDVQDDDGLTPLHLACFNGSDLSISFLLAHDANFNLKTKDGINAMHYAAYNGHLNTIHMLCEKGAPTECMDDRNVTPVHYAAACNHWECIRYLLFKGADVDFMNKEGLTPLAYAVKNGAVDAAALLIENGADPDLKNEKGMTPRKHGKNNRNNPCKQIFDQLGRKPYSAEALAMLSDIRVKLNRKRLRRAGDMKQGVEGGIDSLPGLNAVNRLSSPFSDHGVDFDLNEPAEIADKVFIAAKKLKHHWTFLNVMRHFLLIPNDEMNGRKMWSLIEMFCNQVVLTEPSETTKLKFSEFLPMYRTKDKFTKVKKLDMLVGVENALPILFPNMPDQDEFADVTWRPYDVDGDEEEEDEEDEDEEEYEDEYEDEYEESDRKRKPKKKVGKKRKDWERADGGDDGDGGDKVDLADDEIGVAAKVTGHTVRKEYAGDDQDEWENMMKAALEGPKMPMGGGGGGGGPPPPPGAGPPPPPGAMKAVQAPLPPGREELKDIKLRKLPWKKIPLGKINNTVWAMFKDNSVDIDVPLIIEYFQERKDEKKDEKKKKKERKQVLDLKRANHVGLMLAMLKGKTYKQIRKGIIDLDESIFTEDVLRAFAKLTPQKTDIELLKPFAALPEEQKAGLGDADQFFLEIMDIPRLENRVRAFLFKKTFTTQISELKEMVVDAAAAIKNVSSNFKLAKLLEIILNLGNFLNYKTYAGNAFGFNIDGLLKLRDTKSTKQPDYTVLHYLAQYITENRGKLLGFVEDLEDISKGNNDFITAINGLQAELKAGMATLLGELEVFSANPDPNDPFVGKMEAFAGKAKEEMKALLDDIAALNKAHSHMNTWFIVDKDIDIIDIMCKFRVQFSDALEENKRREEMETKQAKKKKRVVIKKRTTKTRTRRKMPPGGKGAMSKVAMDDGEDGEDGGDAAPSNPAPKKKIVRKKVVRRKVVRKVEKADD